MRRKAASRSDFVFPGRGVTGHLVEPKNCWARILKRAELSDLRLHDLRRSLGSWMAAGGTSLQVVARSLGHQSSSATEVYLRLQLDSVRTAVDTAVKAMLKYCQ